MNMESKMLIKNYTKETQGTRTECILATEETLNLQVYEEDSLNKMIKLDIMVALEYLKNMTDEEFAAIDYSDIPVDIYDPQDMTDELNDDVLE